MLFNDIFIGMLFYTYICTYHILWYTTTNKRVPCRPEHTLRNNKSIFCTSSPRSFTVKSTFHTYVHKIKRRLTMMWDFPRGSTHSSYSYTTDAVHKTSKSIINPVSLFPLYISPCKIKVISVCLLPCVTLGLLVIFQNIAIYLSAFRGRISIISCSLLTYLWSFGYSSKNKK